MNLYTAIATTIVLLIPFNAFARVWTDNTGKFSVEAKFQGIAEDGRVILKKEDGSLVRVPIKRLSKEDQEYLKLVGKKPRPASPKAVSNKDLANAIQEVFRASDEQDSTAKKLLLEKDAVEKLMKKYQQSRITLSFPVKNVTPWEKRYRLHLGAPDFPVRPSIYYRYLSTFDVPLTKKDVLSINPDTRLEVSGSITFSYRAMSRPFNFMQRNPNPQLTLAITVRSPNTDYQLRIHFLTKSYKIVYEGELRKHKD